MPIALFLLCLHRDISHSRHGGCSCRPLLPPPRPLCRLFRVQEEAQRRDGETVPGQAGGRGQLLTPDAAVLCRDPPQHPQVCTHCLFLLHHEMNELCCQPALSWSPLHLELCFSPENALCSQVHHCSVCIQERAWAVPSMEGSLQSLTTVSEPSPGAQKSPCPSAFSVGVMYGHVSQTSAKIWEEN